MKNILILLVLLLAGCYRVSEDLEPKINYAVQDRYLKQLPSPFSPLTVSEKAEPWGKEQQIGVGFAKELDLYQAMTAFKRAQFLAPEGTRKVEMQYEVLLCYYMGKKYSDVIATFENSGLRFVDSRFEAYHDLLVILYDSYNQLGEEEKADQVLHLINDKYPETEKKIVLSSALLSADFCQLECLSDQNPCIPELLSTYHHQKKSINGARVLNALLPGAGYLYLGQTQSAITAFFLNGLFIAAATHFFMNGQVAAGAIITSFEAGWYFGGIHGAALEAKFYNERIYEKNATPFMNREGLFPILTLKYAF